MLPQNRNAFQKNSLSLFRCRRTHQSRRCFCQCLPAGNNGCSHRTDQCCYRSGQCIFPLVMNLKIIGNIVVHHSICLDDYIWKHFFANQNSCHASSGCCQECIIQIFGMAISIFLLSECLHRSDLGPLLFYHSCHGCETDQCRYQEKNDRKNLTNTLDTVCIITIVRIFRKAVPVCNDPFRLFDVVQFFLRIVDLLFSVTDLSSASFLPS